MSTDIQTVSLDSSVVVFADKKGNTHNMSAEGALFKGGAALTALKDMALDLALQKAGQGRYRAAADILGAAFPTTAKAFDTLHASLPWSNKATFIMFLSACSNAKVPAKGWSKRQSSARLLLSALLGLFNDVPAPAEREVIDADQPAEATAS